MGRPLSRRGVLAAAAAFASGAARAFPIGVAGPLGGSSVGRQIGEAARAMTRNLNRQGGVLGEPVALRLADDANNPAQAVSVANLFAGNVRFVIGHAISDTTLAALGVYRQEPGTFLLSPTNARMVTSPPSPRVCRIIPPNEAYADLIVDELLEGGRGRDGLGFVYVNNNYGQDFAKAILGGLSAAGVEPRVSAAVEAGTVDYKAIVSRLRAAQVRAVIVGLYVEGAQHFLRDAAEQRLIAPAGDAARPYLIGHSLLVEGLATPANVTALDGMEIVSVTNCDRASIRAHWSRDPTTVNLLEDFEAEGVGLREITPTHVIITSAFQVYAQAITAAGRLDSTAIAAALHRETFRTVRGDLAFDATGELTRPREKLALYRWGPDALQDGIRLVRTFAPR